MAEHVERAGRFSHALSAEFRAIRAATEGAPLDPTDLDGLSAQYDHLLSGINDSPPPIRPGDLRWGGLARVRCSKCNAEVGVVEALDGRGRGGLVVYYLVTQHPGRTLGDAAREVPVVLGAAGDGPARPPTPRPAVALTWCRSHGDLEIKVGRALTEAQKTLSSSSRGEVSRPGRVTAHPVVHAVQ